MATFNYVNNCLGQLFDLLESHMGGIKLASFSMTEEEREEINPDYQNKKFMKQYEKQYEPAVYKYLYDPDLSFDERFHQRLASISFSKRNEPWVTLMFNIGSVRTVTEVHSTNKYIQVQNSDGDYFDIKTKRVRVPVNMVLVSNDISTLMFATEQLALFFDRIINFEYCEFVRFSTGTEDEYEKAGQCMDITEIDLDKLDTSSRGSLVSSAYSFGLVYWVTRYPEYCQLIEKIIVDFGIKNHDTICTLTVQ